MTVELIEQKAVEQKAKRLARARVADALRAGRLAVTVRCERCSGKGPLEAHHNEGYDYEHSLNVIWLCQGCHTWAHEADTEIRMYRDFAKFSFTGNYASKADALAKSQREAVRLQTQRGAA